MMRISDKCHCGVFRYKCVDVNDIELLCFSDISFDAEMSIILIVIKNI